ncbi:hypothetical protein [Paenibacillus herberti]|uniref:hypothetical protein n=1 Tax=Paenibacillus herberti TaxID=1619309 RepID=UPI001FE75736|nr:hypothetical protein [Paenibacillus herberti]
MKKIKQPGENISLKTKKNESPEVMDWINGQSNLMDSIRYLVENEIREHGVRNLQLFIPAERGTLVAGTAAGRAADGAAGSEVGGAAVAAAVAAPAQPEPAAETPQAAAREAAAAARESAAAAEAPADGDHVPSAERELAAAGIAAGAVAAGEAPPQDLPQQPAAANLEPEPAGAAPVEDDIDDDDIDSWM